ncbi:MAG: RNA polymerase sigma factor [Bacteroidota bacterium]
MTEHAIGEDYLQGLIEKDERVVRRIYEELFPKIRNYVMSNGGTEDDARDLMQKSLMQMVVRAKVRGLVIKTSFEGYLFITAKNFWLRIVKKRNQEVTNFELSTLQSEEQEIADSAVEQEKWELFEEKLAILSENCRRLLGFFFKKFSYKEIAVEMEYSNENVVKQRMFKCKQKLKDGIQSDLRYNELSR